MTDTLIVNETLHYIINRSVSGGGQKQICEINAMNMFEDIQQTPKVAFIFIGLALILLTIYIFYLDRSKSDWVRNKIVPAFLLAPYLLLFAGTYLLFFTTYTVDMTKVFKILEPLVYIVAFIILVYSIYAWLKKNKLKIEMGEK